MYGFHSSLDPILISFSTSQARDVNTVRWSGLLHVRRGSSSLTTLVAAATSSRLSCVGAHMGFDIAVGIRNSLRKGVFADVLGGSSG